MTYLRCLLFVMFAFGMAPSHSQAQSREGDALRALISGIDARNRGDFDLALQQFLVAEAAGLAMAPVHVGYVREVRNGAGDFASAMRWYVKGASRLDSSAMLRLGYVYLSSGNCPEGMAWLNKAVAAGNVDAQYYLGLVHLIGYRTRRDRPLGLRLLTDAANKGHTLSMRELSEIYRRGLMGVRRQPELADEFARRAAKFSSDERRPSAGDRQ